MSNVENMVQEVAEKEVLDNKTSAVVWLMYVTIKSIVVSLDKEKFINAFRQITETEESHELDCLIDELLVEFAMTDMPYEDFVKQSKKYEVTESSITEHTATMLKLYQILMGEISEEELEN